MTTLVVGATGATGRLLVQQLLARDEAVKVIVRSPEKLPDSIRDNSKLTVIQASLLDLTDQDMAQHVAGCDAIASCLGHNMTFQGLFGQPRRLVTDAVSRLCDAAKANAPDHPVKFVLMNTTGNRNRDLSEPISFGEKAITSLMRLLLPPHADNEHAADYLRVEIGQDDPVIEWAAVRPDNLIDEGNVTEYEIHASPIRSAILNPGKTSRINVGHFMADLITDPDTWARWKGQMPVIYNKE
ncbi:MAG: NAD-dependent epimerase [Anaerolineaceae bacterium]|nr:NAD-dependent epimerase [Anaerolineaceae bacterium]